MCYSRCNEFDSMQLTSSVCLPLELEQSYEIKRTERKNRKSRGRPPKRARRDKEVSSSENIGFTSLRA